MLLGVGLHAMLSFVGWPVWPVQDSNQSELYGIPILFIHGFRMPLFFFVSGFFTMMLWKRKGAQALICNRFKRIVLPFFFFGILLIPLLNHMRSVTAWIAPESISETSDIELSTPPAKNQIEDLGWASKEGNIQLMQALLEDGADINGEYQKSLTPLHWAAANGKTKAVLFLLKNGANSNALDGYLCTPLHWAAFFGQEDSLSLLLENGANPKMRNKDNSSPKDATYAGKSLTEMVARDILRISFRWKSLQNKRLKCRNLLETYLEKNRIGETGESNFFRTYYLTFGDFITHHLWFLYDLIYLITAFLILSCFHSLLSLKKLACWIMSSRYPLFFLVPITYVAQFYMKEDFGPSTHVWLAQDWTKLGYYGIFFGYGVICFQNHVFTQRTGNLWRLSLPGAVTAFLTALICLHYKEETWSYEILTLCSACFAWLMVFGCIGLFKKYFSIEMPKVRFVSDSAYWIYLIHLPIVQILQAVVSYWPLPSLLKCSLVCLLSTVLLLFTYRYFIRYSWIGTMLNGTQHQ
jgi:peptidoglycan/LPS O-acetylase OafA/YrhL